METKLSATHTPARLASAVKAAAHALEEGQVVALPTETVYGLAANALQPDAVARIFEAKERPLFDPLIVHLPSREWLERVTRIPEESRELIEKLIARFWPGPLTLVLPRSRSVPDLVTSGMETVAVRMSVHPVFRAVIENFGKPLAAPSANRFGRISPTTAEHVESELGGAHPADRRWRTDGARRRVDDPQDRGRRNAPAARRPGDAGGIGRGLAGPVPRA